MILGFQSNEEIELFLESDFPLPRESEKTKPNYQAWKQDEFAGDQVMHAPKPMQYYVATRKRK